MNRISRADIDVLCRPGDVITVEYLKKDLTAKLISAGEDGRATHALCCCGGLDIVEACITGVTESNLRNYLRGNCRLTVRSALRPPTVEQATKATSFWLRRVNDKYDLPMIFGMVPLLLAKHLVGLFSKDLSDWCLQKMPNLLASSNLSTCAELATRGLREFTLVALYKYPAENVDPEILRTDPSLATKAVLHAPVLID